MMERFGLVLTGGGARAAYQAGALRAISDICDFKENPFSVIAGVSAGAINGAAVGVDAQDFRLATAKLWELWKNLRAEDVFHTDTLTLMGIGSRWIKDLSLGGFLGSSHSSYLLDTAPLRKLLWSHLDFEKMRTHLTSGLLHGMAISSTNYHSGTAVSFYEGSDTIRPWVRGTRIARKTTLTPDHVLASSAIPLFFPPVRLEQSYYGDGCIRLTAPLSPAVHMGATRILAIGIRYFRPLDLTLELNEKPLDKLSLVDIAGVMLNAVFLDSLETDLERMERVNRTMARLSPEVRAANPDELRLIPIRAIKPSKDLGTLASEQFRHFPPLLRHLLKGVGASDEKGWDLLSYLAFDSAYTSRALELGYQDTLNQKDELLAFFEGAKASFSSATK